MPFDHKGWGEEGWTEPEIAKVHTEPKGLQKEHRDQFIKEYMRDFNPVNAAIRCGFAGPKALEVSDRYMGEPYVMRGIQDAIEAIDLNPDNSFVDNMKRTVIMNLASQSQYDGANASHAARIKATETISKLMGMEPDKKVNVKHNTSGVMMVPGVASIEEWETEATVSQNKLLDDTQNDAE